MLLVIEGIDGAGKTTAIERIIKPFLEKQLEVSVLYKREPGGSPLAEELRRIILRDDVDDFSTLLLMIACRNSLIKTAINPHLRKGGVVVCDRFYQSTLVYQHVEAGFDRSFIDSLQRHLPAVEAEIFTIYFELPPSIARERSLSRKKVNRYDTKPISFYENIANGYEKIAEEDLRSVTVDARLPLDKLKVDIEGILKKIFKLS